MEKLIIPEEIVGLVGKKHPSLSFKVDKNIKMEVPQGVKTYEIIGEINSWSNGVQWLDYILNGMEPNDPLHLVINSHGGDFFEGVAMYNRLLMHKGQISATVIGICASAATLPLMAAPKERRRIGAQASIMIHNTQLGIYGDKNTLSKAIELMTSCDTSVIDLYSEATGLSPEKIKEMMDNETFLIGQEAVDLGFANELITIKNEATETRVENKNKITFF